MSAICLQRNVFRLFSPKWASTFEAQYSTGAVFDVKPFDLFKLDKGPETKASVTKDEALDYYTKMQTMRRLETSAANLYREKLIRGFCHLYSGQEAVAVGMRSVMRPQDNVISAYRVHGWAYLMGATPAQVLGELVGKRSGSGRGKGGSMHLYTKSFYGGNGIVGAQVPLGAGIALASQYSGDGGICYTLYGDGAANQGQVFEAFNMAKLWSLPCVFVCENNGYGMGTSVERSSASTEYYTRGDYIPGLKVDGMDVLAVREGTKFAVEYITAGNGPIVMEMVTYRYSGHSMSDPGTSYRSREEVQEYRSKKDPITCFKDKVVTAGLVTEAELKAIDTAAKEEVDKAHKAAVADAEIGVEELVADIYCNPLESSIRDVVHTKKLQHMRIGEAKNS